MSRVVQSIYPLKQDTVSSALPNETEQLHIELADLNKVEHATCTIVPESRMVMPGAGHVPVVERLRVLEHRLNHLRQTRPFKRILVTSAAPREGKTVVALNLAATLARTSSRVLLIDADMRRSGVARALGLKPGPGLPEILEGKLTLAEALRLIEPLNVFYLSSGESVNEDQGDLLKTPRTRELFQQLGEQFDWIIVDSCPILPFSDAHRLAAITDAVLMVVRAEVTSRTDLQDALAALTNYHLLGIVLNGSEDAREQGYYSYYKRK